MGIEASEGDARGVMVSMSEEERFLSSGARDLADVQARLRRMARAV